MQYEREQPPADELDLDKLEIELMRIIASPIVRSANGNGDDIYLGRSWLGAIHSYVLKQQGATSHEARLIQADKKRRLVAIANRLELDVDELLAAEPREEVKMVCEAVRVLDND